MKLPMLMNLVEIKIRKESIENTVWDDVFKEPVGTKNFSSEITIKGQANLGSKRYYQLSRSLTGDTERSSIYLVFRTADLEEQGVEITKGDRVVKVADRNVNFEVTQVRPESPLNGRFLLTYVELETVVEERASVSR